MKDLVHGIIGMTMIIFWVIGMAVSSGWMMYLSIFPPIAWIQAARFFLGVSP